MNPRLRLNKERLTELTTSELADVAGGAPPTINLGCLSVRDNCNSVYYCTTAMSCGGGCESFDVCN